MKKKGLIIILLFATLLASCTRSASEQSDSSGSTAGTHSSEEMAVSLYKKFLSNEAKVNVNTDTIFERIPGSGNQEYTLEEFAEYLLDAMSGPQKVVVILKGIDYAYIDCGIDGNKELALRYFITQNGEPNYFNCVIKEFNGTLRNVYIRQSWSRSSVFLNEFGYICCDGSGGAAFHGFEKSYIDVSGEWHYLYYNGATMGLSSHLSTYTVFYKGANYKFYDANQLDGVYELFQFDFNNTRSDDSDDIYTYGKLANSNETVKAGISVRGYFFLELVKDDSLFSDSHPLKKFLRGKE